MGKVLGIVCRAVQTRLFELTVRDIKKRNRKLPPEEVISMSEAALSDSLRS